MSGPLKGIRVVEMAGIGPAPFCAMMLADMGAEVIRIDRLTESLLGSGGTVVDRGRRTIALDIKKDHAKEILHKLIARSDVLIEGFRPGVMEKLGLGPDVCFEQNPKLIYSRMTGWGQTGLLSKTAGHDINYLSLTGVLHAMGQADRPPAPPLHLVGDQGGGAMMLAFGIVCALFEAQKSGKGQVIDAAISDGASTLGSIYHSLLEQGKWQNQREANLLDGGAPFYTCYTCKDGKYISIGAIEPQFYQLLLEKCELTDPIFARQMDKSAWPEIKQKFTELFKSKTRQEWCELLEGTDACFAPVLDFEEAASHPHNTSRNNFIKINGMTAPAASPRLSRTPATPGEIFKNGHHTAEILNELGYGNDDLEKFRQIGLIK
ncbi:CaiB/BaiF CoA transferase family protein [Advenella sp. RU8]|uniref:CaiB/BaiF CoA transferase family protein n=1 Tax=Advenella sp. RU8 TaxID=3399575 RepID=UPI003AAAB480